MFSLSAIGLEKKILNEIVYYKTKYSSTFICLFLSLQENESRYGNEFDIIRCAFELCRLCGSFNFLFVFLVC